MTDLTSAVSAAVSCTFLLAVYLTDGGSELTGSRLSGLPPGSTDPTDWLPGWRRAGVRVDLCCLAPADAGSSPWGGSKTARCDNLLP